MKNGPFFRGVSPHYRGGAGGGGGERKSLAALSFPQYYYNLGSRQCYLAHLGYVVQSEGVFLHEGADTNVLQLKSEVSGGGGGTSACCAGKAKLANNTMTLILQISPFF